MKGPILRSPRTLESFSSLKGLFTMLKPSLHSLVDIHIEFSIDYGVRDDGPLAGLCHELEKMVSQNVVEGIELWIWAQAMIVRDGVSWRYMNGIS